MAVLVGISNNQGGKTPKWPLLLALCVFSLGCGGPSSLNELAAPWVAWEQKFGYCDYRRAASEGKAWEERRCEGSTSGFNSVGTLRAAAWKELLIVFPALPSTDQNTTSDCKRVTNDFHYQMPAGKKLSWRTCTDDLEFGKVGALPEPYRSVAQLLFETN